MAEEVGRTELDKIMDGCWENVRDDVFAITEEALKQTQTPAAQASVDGTNKAILARAYLALLAESIFRAEFTAALGVKAGVLSAQEVGNIIGHARMYTQGVVRGDRFICIGSKTTEGQPCNWRGELQEVMPSGFCPGCGHSQTLRPAPALAAGPVPFHLRGEPRPKFGP